MRSVDITFDDPLDAAVRDLWTALSDVGLPSLASHRGASNRPHITLAVGPGLELIGRPRLRPLAVRLGGAVLFPRRSGAVLALGVAPTPELLDLHGRVSSSVTGGLDHTRPGAWTPHVTISRRLTPQQIADAIAVLGSLGDPPVGRVTGLRFWNGDTSTVTDLAGIADGGRDTDPDAAS